MNHCPIRRDIRGMKLQSLAIMMISMTMPALSWAASLENSVSRYISTLSSQYRAEEITGQRRIRRIVLPDGAAVVLVFFNMEGFGGRGNDWSQYLTAFSELPTDGDIRYRPIVEAEIGGREWRSVDTGNPVTAFDPKSKELTITLPALVNTERDLPNFPSRKEKIVLQLKLPPRASLREIHRH